MSAPANAQSQPFLIGQRVQVRDSCTTDFSRTSKYGFGEITGFSQLNEREKVPLIRPDGWEVATTFSEVIVLASSALRA